MPIQRTNLGIIFDMDGTMFDNMEVHHAAWHQELNKNGITISLDEVRQTIHGKNEEIIKKIYGTHLSDEQIHALADEKEFAYRMLYQKDLRLRKGLEQFVTTLRKNNIPIAIGTAAPSKNVDFALDGLNIRSWFNTIVDAEMVEQGKPHPEVFLKAAHYINKSTQHCIVFEDSPTGAMAAANAGMDMFIVGQDYAQKQFAHIKGIVGFIDDYDNALLHNHFDLILNS